MQSEKRTLLCADNMAALAEMPENSIDAVVTDPPYGLAFMGKRWDYDVPSVELWRKVLRVLRPGGHVLSFGGTRTYHRMVVNIEDAGFEIRDQLQWLYGSGFPKSHNIKEGDFKGWGTALKPANEPIVVARKPLEKGLTIAENVLKYGTGAINVDECRIDLQAGEVTHGSGRSQSSNPNTGFGDMGEKRVGVPNIKSTQGRWPANVILDEDAAEVLDEQSGVLKAGVAVKRNSAGKNIFSESKKPTSPDQGYKDFGGASRFFYCAKASKRERNAGLESLPLHEAGIKNDSGRWFSESDPHKKIMAQNHHPTVKPIALMRYLCKLITPPDGTILDPFMGSGTTGIAAKLDGFGFVGIELDADYFKIAQKRIESWVSDAK